MTSETYDLLADLLSYPSNETRNALDRCRTQLRSDAPDAVASLDRFAEQTSSMSTEGLQELYTQSFDLNPTCSLEVGWQLYGENYSRGELLVEMRKTLRRLGVAETTELPDHLTLVLAALGRMDAEEAGRFSAQVLLPALTKMQQGLSGKPNPYANVLEAIRLTRNEDVQPVRCPAPGRHELPILSTTEPSLATDNWQLPTQEGVCHG